MTVEYGHETNHACEHGVLTAENHCERCDPWLKNFLVVYRYKTRPRYRKGKWKEEEKAFSANDLAEALRLAKSYAESTFRSQWVIDVCTPLPMTREKEEGRIRKAAKEGFWHAEFCEAKQHP
jgi:hypothetical protein